jgi:ubiquinone/menaquinone biosynthesis C-methylase UbiE
VLDIGCGDRWAENALGPGCTYLGLDYPSTVELGYAGAPDVFGDGLQLPFPDQCFDSVLLMDVLEHLRDAPKALSEAARVLKPGGTLILQVPFLVPAP